MNQDQPPCDRFEATLREAVDVPVPPDLRAKILARQAAERSPRWWQPPWPRLGEGWVTATAVACGLVLVLVLVTALGFYAAVLHDPEDGLREQILAYMEQDWPQLSRPGAVPDHRLEGMFHEIGAHLAAPLQRVTYCEMTRIGHRPCAVLVTRGQAGPVATLLIKDAHVPARMAIHTPHFDGVILPAPQGCIAVLGQPGEDLEVVENRVMKAISWL